jgi:hypothetical protein
VRRARRPAAVRVPGKPADATIEQVRPMPDDIEGLVRELLAEII